MRACAWTGRGLLAAAAAAKMRLKEVVVASPDKHGSYSCCSLGNGMHGPGF